MENSLDTPIVSCAVCGESAPVLMTAECNWCDRRYHLNQRNDVDSKDCGQVWIDEQYLALQFACFDCVRNGGAPGDPSAPTPPSSRVAKTQRQRRYKRRA